MKYVLIPEKKSKPLQCQRCGHIWDYSGLNAYVVSCPHCKTSVSVKKNSIAQIQPSVPMITANKT